MSSPGASRNGPVVVLAGGTGGGKLAAGLAAVAGAGRVTVVANTGDDTEVYGVHVSPDPDLVTYWLCDLIDEHRGYGIRNDTWRVMTALEAAGADPWFRLGDRDLATCLVRTEMLRAGERLTDAAQRIADALGSPARVLPMADEPVRTHVVSRGRALPFQEFMVRERAAAPIEAVELRGVAEASATPEVRAAIEGAKAIVIGPSNPVASIGPMLAVPGLRDAVASAPAPVVAVSPFVGGRSLKGPTEAFCRHAGLPVGGRAVVEAYRGLLDGVVADDPLREPGLATHVADTRMPNAARRRAVAASTLEFAASLTA